MTLRGPVIELVNGPLDGQHKEWMPELEIMTFAEMPKLPDRYEDYAKQNVVIEPIKHHQYRRGTLNSCRGFAYYIEQ